MCRNARPVLLSTIVVCVIVMPVPAIAGIIAADDFTYPDGPLWGANGGTGWTIFWTTSFPDGGIEVAGGVAQGALLGNNPKYAARNFLNPESTNQLFVAFDLQTPAAINTDDYFFLQLYVGVNNNLLTFGKLAGSNRFQAGNGGFSSSSFDILPDTTYHLIGAYDIRHVPNGDPDRINLWINPDASDYYNVVTGAGSADVSGVDFVASHASSLFFATNTVAGYKIDNLVISNMAEGVGLNRTTTVPEPSMFALAALGLAGLVAPGVGRRWWRRVPHSPAA
jgi:hypothetical protein